MHGYQLSRELGAALGGFWRVSYGSLYPTLRRLERTAPWRAWPTARPAARRKNTYRDHGEGREALLRAAAGDAARQRHRGHRVPGAPRVLPLPAARDADPAAGTPPGHLEDRLSTIKDSLHTTRERVDTYTLSLMEHGRAPRSPTSRWLEGLIAAERRHRIRHGRGPRGHEAPRAAPRASQKGAHIMSKVRLAIVGVGNCASSLVQGLEYYKDADPGRTRARTDARGARRLPRPRHRGRRRLRRGREEGRPRRVRGDLHRAEQHDPVRRRAAARA